MKAWRFMASVFLFVYLFLFRAQEVRAIGNIYFVATGGSDSNLGTLTSPFRTIGKGASVLIGGDILYIRGGTYNEQLSISQSGTLANPIVVSNYNNESVVVDLQSNGHDNVSVTGSYVTVKGLELTNSDDRCSYFHGQYMTIEDLIIHNCNGMGLYIDGQHVIADGNTVYLSSLINQDRSMPSGWGSGIKLRVGADDVVLSNNTTYHNYGEGIAATRAKNVQIRNNYSYDNYAVNFYIDNSYNVTVEKNIATCSVNTGFERDGHAAYGYALGEESYSGWGAQLANIVIKNNISGYCYKGIGYLGSDVPGGGLKNVTIAFNTLWGSTGTELSIANGGNDANTQGTLIANNIVQQDAGKEVWIESLSGITMSHNFWSPAAPGSPANGPGDLSGNPAFSSTPSTSPESYRLSSVSTAIGSALYINGISDDFMGMQRTSVSGLDMGAMVYSAAYSCSALPGDANGDSKVDGIDYVTVIRYYGQTTTSGPAMGDVNCDGRTDLGDFNLVINNIHWN